MYILAFDITSVSYFKAADILCWESLFLTVQQDNLM